jgi:hypothetical protein
MWTELGTVGGSNVQEWRIFQQESCVRMRSVLVVPRVLRDDCCGSRERRRVRAAALLPTPGSARGTWRRRSNGSASAAIATRVRRRYEEGWGTSADPRVTGRSARASGRRSTRQPPAWAGLVSTGSPRLRRAALDRPHGFYGARAGPEWRSAGRHGRGAAHPRARSRRGSTEASGAPAAPRGPQPRAPAPDASFFAAHLRPL